MISRMAIPDVLLIRPPRYSDARGWFSEAYNVAAMDEAGVPRFVQDNESLSAAVGTVRGLHFQRGEFSQAKLVRCVTGAIFDVAVDIRPGSATFGKHVAARLDATEGAQMFIPAGFAHGFCTLAPDSLIQYKVSTPYSRANESGIAWNDPALGIDWPVSADAVILSDRDRALPHLKDAAL
ncbi:MAG: dTDP-4-dehydrorhamnose 3,5-epimerase [Hyphomonadaceae bacterium]